MAEARSVEGKHAVMASQAIEHAARLEVALRHGVAVDQHDGRALASLDDVEPDALDVKQAARRRLLPLGSTRAALDPGSGQRRAEERDASPGGRARASEVVKIGSVHGTSTKKHCCSAI